MLLFLTIDGQYVVKYKNNKFPGSELYRKMCPFVSESCLHQKLCQITGCEKNITLCAWENEKIDPLQFGHFFCYFCPEIWSICCQMSKITIPLNSWGQICMGKCVDLSLCVVYFKCYATFYIIFDFSGSGRVQQRVKNEAFGHYFSLVPNLILK